MPATCRRWFPSCSSRWLRRRSLAHRSGAFRSCPCRWLRRYRSRRTHPRRSPCCGPAGWDQHLVSTGKGRTTCGYFLPDNKHIVYASTHLAGDACPTPPDRSKGYVWGVFAGFDIFEATDTGKIEKRLTDAPGYDAEATVNYKTGTIVYTSLASGDLDLWTMKADGSAKKQL